MRCARVDGGVGRIAVLGIRRAVAVTIGASAAPSREVELAPSRARIDPEQPARFTGERGRVAVLGQRGPLGHSGGIETHDLAPAGEPVLGPRPRQRRRGVARIDRRLGRKGGARRVQTKESQAGDRVGPDETESRAVPRERRPVRSRGIIRDSHVAADLVPRGIEAREVDLVVPVAMIPPCDCEVGSAPCQGRNVAGRPRNRAERQDRSGLMSVGTYRDEGRAVPKIIVEREPVARSCPHQRQIVDVRIALKVRGGRSSDAAIRTNAGERDVLPIGEPCDGELRSVPDDLAVEPGGARRAAQRDRSRGPAPELVEHKEVLGPRVSELPRHPEMRTVPGR